jgi:hypothetical protein
MEVDRARVIVSPKSNDKGAFAVKGRKEGDQRRARSAEGKAGRKPFREWWADYKKEEKALEEAKYALLRPR